ncbi:hypothetical protein C0W50_19820 [Photobacterium leiognathi subsp. mandapamensis]|nr:hypothetical protein C0W50_19820 [Photobacterium leiognathi subsp. mandapamensis]
MQNSAEFAPYTAKQKAAWAKQQAHDNATYLTEQLGFSVNPRIPFVLLQAARDVLESGNGKSRLPTRICQRLDHYKNTVKVLATAILHYDLANNLVATRDEQHKVKRCDNGLFANLLGMPSRTVDNCIYSLKRSGLYLSFEKREKQLDSQGQIIGFSGLASIKRINMVLFEMLGLGELASVQRAKAKQRRDQKRYSKTPAQQAIEEYKKTDDALRAKRDQQRAEAKVRKQSKLAVAQSKNRTQDILALIANGYSHQAACAEIKRLDALEQPLSHDPLDDIPY